MKLTNLIPINNGKSISKLLFITALSINSLYSYAQHQQVSLTGSNVTLKTAFKQIEQQTKLFVDYNTQEVNDSRVLTKLPKNSNVKEVMEQLLEGSGCSITFSNGHIIINKQDRVASTTKNVSGIVKDERGEPVIGANVVVKGTTNGTVTDMNGRYSLSVPEGSTLQISYIGYNTQEVKVGSGNVVNVSLREDSEALDEVVVIGYGTVKKSDLTGAVGSVQMKDVSQVGITSADRALQGQIAGVQVNARTGQPGESMMIRVRGSNSLAGGNEPLYVIDGMPVEKMNSDINPEDILSMEVLKDASSTAIYGSRGANGVVMITTKRGRTGDTVLEYNGYVGISSLRKKLDLLGKDDYIAMVNEVSQNDGNGIAITPEQAASLPNNDWQDLAYQTALTHSHQVSVSGGTDKTKLYSSLNYMNQEGIIKGSNYNRFALRINGDQKLARNLSLNASIAYSYGTQNTANSNADGWGAIAYTAMVMSPIQEIKDADGKYTNFSGTPWGGTNPVGMAELYKDKTVNSRLLANLSLIYDIIDGLTFRVNAGAEVNAASKDRYIPIGLSAGGKLDGDASKEKANYYTIINENILTYDKKFNKNHALNLMGGVTFQTYQWNQLKGSGTGFLRDVYETNNLGVASTPGIPASGFSDYRMVSFLGRANYNLMERYLLTVTARYDGSSKFSKNHKFAFFPSAALAWRVSEEDFMKDIDWMSNLKLRGSVGQTGNQSIDPYQTFAQLGTSSPIFGGGKDIGFGLSSMANDDLKWETTTQTDIGVDMGFFGNRLSVSFDYYWKQTRDLLYKATLPPSSGYSSMLRNLGRIDNKGFEISINTINMKGKVNWTTNLNITSNKSVVKDLGSDVYGNKIQRIDAPIGGGNWFPLFVGKAPFQLYGYEIEGIYQTDEEARQNGEATKKAGDYRYKDTDGKAGITTGDKTIIANTQPKFTFGLTNVINWNNFELSFLVIGSVGGDIVNEFNKSITNIGGTWNVRKDVWQNHWTPENPNAKYARASAATKDYLAFGDPSSVWVENGSYLRFKDIKLAYALPSQWFAGSRKPNISVYLSGQNLITITSYSHYDPEASWTSSAVNGWDRGVYPSAKSFTLGLQVKF
ncbi:SusC/RagA family TonB-linked outer membrane protein [Parabacteroides gordonii]|uniref:SusC/RagA family TonB-linked outer membrane protein n=1 Tax=Parabacteroides gordonii MS-1 = DSM 23371 TaxID=1203610 RepID=A0A0F5JDR3_9BACT|nr:TonB-dependent receptor [Parabacteroides gordonii]KKB55577.1 SusC/RagA family TonB-linked outer membrane protein [Parabacteroides gordonii MS-1 = DSM 23371]MCA5581636.1 TonB-dependent receptor [Parabacteroides gordonii]RGP18111.1 TonB-dependent receptor [Parabacteroides gordonii]